MSNKLLIDSVRKSLSAARLGTYERESFSVVADDLAPLKLYSWNAQVSAALLAPLHVCEVVVRNAASDALEAVYGPRWPWSSGFLRSLPNSGGYNPQRDLEAARRSQPTAGKVIPELKFVFWQKMFTQRHDARLWIPHLRTVLPNIDPTKSIQELRQGIYDDLELIRRLRNRIAHHEPIFKRNLNEDFECVGNLVGFRCATTKDWMKANQHATTLIGSKP